MIQGIQIDNRYKWVQLVYGLHVSGVNAALVSHHLMFLSLPSTSSKQDNNSKKLVTVCVRPLGQVCGEWRIIVSTISSRSLLLFGCYCFPIIYLLRRNCRTENIKSIPVHWFYCFLFAYCISAKMFPKIFFD